MKHNSKDCKNPKHKDTAFGKGKTSVAPSKQGASKKPKK